MRRITHLSCISAIIALSLSAIGCKKEESGLNKLYSRDLTLRHVDNDKLGSILNSMAIAAKTSKKDIRKDADGSDMFLYSSSDVVIFVRRKFDEPCDEFGCTWKVGVSPADTALSNASQKELVDTAFTSITGAQDIQSHMNIKS